LEHLPIWPPESRQQQQSTLPPSRFGTKLPKTPRFNQLRKRYKADLIDMASAYTGGIVQNHPFVDGNKRTGFVVGILFLELNGYRFTATEAAAADAVLSLAAGTQSEADYTSFLCANVVRE
jgi:death-on-curing family protein